MALLSAKRERRSYRKRKMQSSEGNALSMPCKRQELERNNGGDGRRESVWRR
jgi:hypothetical protein